MKNFICVPLLLALSQPAATLAFDPGCADVGDPAAIENVRTQRQAFNQAIAEEDLQSIEIILHENVLLVTGTDSDIYRGREAQLAIWDDDFGNPDRAVYKRTPACIRVSPVFPIALEYGNWRGERQNRTEDFAAGGYAAKWRRIDGHWRLESEIFSTEACGGDFCPANNDDG
ncbi:MAG: nuclear transport factor 2 family protein [Lysobacterales bacterium]